MSGNTIVSQASFAGCNTMHTIKSQLSIYMSALTPSSRLEIKFKSQFGAGSKMEAVYSCEMSLYFQWTAYHSIQEDITLS
jgi:hypothetical protein